MPFEFTEERLYRFQDLLGHYPERQAAMLPTLHLVQEQNGYVSDECVEYVASLLEVTPAQVRDVVTFYPMFFQHPVGRYIIRVCKTLPCMLCDCRAIFEHLHETLGIESDQTTEDGKFTLVEVECLAACHEGPVMMVNDDLHGKLTPKAVDGILNALE